MICPNCQTPNRSAARYCDGCGYELPSLEPLQRPPAPSDPFDDEDFLAEPEVDQSSIPTIDLRRSASIYGGSVRLPDMRQSAETADLPAESYDGEDDEDEPLLPVIREGDDGMSRAITQPLDGEDEPEPEPEEAFADEVLAVPAEQPQMARAAVRDYRSADEQLPEQAGRDPHAKRRALIIAAAIVLAAILITLTTVGVQQLGGTAVPDVTGLSQVDGTYVVQESGFQVSIEEVISDEVEGIVLSTNPAAGTRLAEGSTVTLRISRPRVIPEVVGLSLEDAEKLMAEEGFTNFEITRTKSNETADSVISVTPSAMTTARSDAHIVLEVAEPFRVPEVTGASQTDATAILDAEGYKVVVQLFNTEDTPEGTAVKTDPVAGSVLPSGSQVTLYVAHNRSVELEQLTRSHFEDMQTLTIDGQLYEMVKVDDVTFDGGNTCSFSITVRPIQTVTWFGTQTETRYGSYQTVRGTITWTDENKVAAIDPAIKQGG